MLRLEPHQVYFQLSVLLVKKSGLPRDVLGHIPLKRSGSLGDEGLIWWGKDGFNQPRLKRFLKENKEGVVPITLWLSDNVGHNQEAKAENAKLLPELNDLFATPKPERLIQRILQLSTDENDWVLDSFAGSGTTRCCRPQNGAPLDHGGVGVSTAIPISFLACKK